MRVAWLAALLLTSWYVLEATGSQETFASTALETEQYMMDSASVTLDEQREALDDALDVGDNMKSSRLLKKKSALVTLGKFVGHSLNAVHAAGAIANFILTFFMHENNDVQELLNKRFNEVNAKLDRLDEKLDEIQKSIKANVAFNVFLAQWIGWENAVENGQLKLRQIRNDLGRTTDKVRKVKLMEEYVNYYESNNIDDNLMNLYKMAAHAEGTTHRNVFDLFIAEHGCDVTMLARLMIVIKNVITSGSQQKVTYHVFKGDAERAKEKFDEIQVQFFEIRKAFDVRVWQCRSNGIEQAKTETKKILREMRKVHRENVLQIIQRGLKVKFPEYTWAVAGARTADVPQDDFKIRGESFFRVDDDSNPNDVKIYYVMYGDTLKQIACNQVHNANTLYVFKKCEDCGKIAAGDGILSSDNCSKKPLIQSFSLRREANVKLQGQCKRCAWDQFIYYFRRGIGCGDDSQCRGHICKFCSSKILHRHIDPWNYMASRVSPRTGACGTDKCSGNGQCKEIPYTASYQCICKPFYDGGKCEKRIHFDNSVEKMMGELREEFTVVNGVPTTVEVFFSLRDLKQDMVRMWHDMQASFAHTKQIIQHSDTILAAEDLADLYGRLQRNEISFEKFGHTLDSYLGVVASPFQLENRMKKMILGEGVLASPGGDIFSTFKREHASVTGMGCTEGYNRDVKKFRNTLAYLDQTVCEVLLLHKKWLIETRGTTEVLRNRYKAEAEYIQRLFSGRQAIFHRHWRRESCAPFKVNGSNVDCKSELTFEGMSIEPVCRQQKQADSGRVMCVKQNGTNVWDGQPVCKFTWGSYGDWSSCTKSCDGGQKYQNRTCLGTQDLRNCERDQGGKSYRTHKCNTQACCSDGYGKYKCKSGRCISKSQFCDGRNNCGDNEDESESRCPDLIRSGMKVAFENDYRKSTWLSCYCWSNKAKCLKIHGTCKLGGCAGTVISGDDWSKCWGEAFFIHGIDREDGDAIRSGDRVGLRYRTKKSRDWFSCWHKHCNAKPCPGYDFTPDKTSKCMGEVFRIFSPNRLGSCTNNAGSSCIGQPIHHGDMILLYYPYERNWVTQWNWDIMKHNCGGKEFTKNSNCNSQKWWIFSEKGSRG